MNEILEYLTTVLKQPGKIAGRNAEKLSKYDDIKTEFLKVVKDGDYPENGLSIHNHTAKEIHQLASFMNFCGVYNFMVTLKEDPEFAEKTISEGFKLK